MPETRYIEETNYPRDLPPEEKTSANAKANGWIKQIPYEVSDKELEAERKQQALDELIAERVVEISKRE